MSGLEVVLYAYLAGWLGTSAIGVANCDDSSRVVTKNECRVGAALSGAIWPALLISKLKR